MCFRYVLARMPAPLISLNGRSVRPRPVVQVTLVGPAGSFVENALVDSGADDTIFSERIPVNLGIDLSQAPTGVGRGVGGAAYPSRYAELTMRLADKQERREWNGWVGFTTAHSPFALLGFAGCLQYFTTTFHGDREELVMTVNALYPGT